MPKIGRDLDRILVLEDDEGRCSWFDRRFNQYQRDTTHDVSLAIKWLQERDYLLIFLDHDLAAEHYDLEMADDGLTGYVVAAWLAAHPHCQPATPIIIHSLNYPGSQRMLRCLLNAGRKAEHVPFHYLPSLLLRSIQLS
jgi:CheY-like chemotaxis protein